MTEEEEKRQSRVEYFRKKGLQPNGRDRIPLLPAPWEYHKATDSWRHPTLGTITAEDLAFRTPDEIARKLRGRHG